MVYAVAIASRDAETQAHALLDRWHAHGEWFDLGPHAERFIRTLKKCRTAADLMVIFEGLKQNSMANEIGKDGKCQKIDQSRKLGNPYFPVVSAVGLEPTTL